VIARLSYVMCDNPDGYACPAAQPGDNAQEARQIAKADGWARRDGKDLCPNCKRAGGAS
jgi:hypothetical protein